ncbi:MAG: sugar transferase [Elusimicrobia bacterium]|nr:sugar transferase [Elusimicrobiota bacterium]
MIARTLNILIRAFYILFDIFVVAVSVFTAVWLNQKKFPFDIRELFFDPTNPFHRVFALWLGVVLFFHGAHHLYQTRREVIEGHELGRVARSIVCAALTVIVFVFSFKIADFPRSVFLLMVVLTLALSCLWRILKRLFVQFLAANGYNNFHVLIVGAGKVGLMLAEEIKRHPGYGMRIVGFLDDRKKSADLGGDYEVLGTLNDLEEVVRRKFVSHLFITIHPGGTCIHQMLELAKGQRLAVRVIPEAFDRAAGDLFKYNIGFIPVLEYTDLGRNRRQFGKRPFDLLVSAVALVVLSPVFLAISLAIKMDSPGPVLFFSRRYGRAGRVFRMWKFRSMVVDAEERKKALAAQNEVDGPIFKIRRDPRVTRIGKFLRKYSLDELPQLVNVLLGEMSLVGPRPLPLDQVQHEDLRQLKRLEIRPGITGLWQVRGRSDLPFHRLIKWDAWYINNWSFMLDAAILLETVPVVVRGKGAY